MLIVKLLSFSLKEILRVICIILRGSYKKIEAPRYHGTTGKVPNQLLRLEQEVLLPLPIKNGNVVLNQAEATLTQRPVPTESLQHPLSIYDQFLEASHAAI